MIPYSEALTTIAAVSATLWTGGLVVFQLRINDKPGRNLTLLVAAMSCAAFGALAPMFGLFLSGTTMRVTAGMFAVFYFLYARGNWLLLFTAIKARTSVAAPLLMQAANFAMVGVAIWPDNYVIAWESAMLAWVDYLVFFFEILKPPPN
jgi:hypothetical protein